MAYIASGAWICHTGRHRKVNEDACLFGGTFSGASASAPMRARVGPGRWVVAVADGIGGHKGGAFASRDVVETLARCEDPTPGGVGQILQDANRRLFHIGTTQPEFAGCGAAVVGIFAGPDGLFGFNVGDSRIYRQEGGRMRQVTRDDSVEQMLVSEGLLPRNAGIRAASMHALTQSVGGSSEYVPITPHFHLLPILKTARFILCTDGLTDMLSAQRIEEIAVPILGASAAVQTLFTAAMDAGGRDNCTIAVVDIERSSE